MYTIYNTHVYNIQYSTEHHLGINLWVNYVLNYSINDRSLISDITHLSDDTELIVAIYRLLKACGSDRVVTFTTTSKAEDEIPVGG